MEHDFRHVLIPQTSSRYALDVARNLENFRNLRLFQFSIVNKCSRWLKFKALCCFCLLKAFLKKDASSRNWICKSLAKKTRNVCSPPNCEFERRNNTRKSFCSSQNFSENLEWEKNALDLVFSLSEQQECCIFKVSFGFAKISPFQVKRNSSFDT